MKYSILHTRPLLFQLSSVVVWTRSPSCHRGGYSFEFAFKKKKEKKKVGYNVRVFGIEYQLEECHWMWIFSKAFQLCSMRNLELPALELLSGRVWVSLYVVPY